MRSKVRTRVAPPPSSSPAPSSGPSRASGLILGVVLLAGGVAIGLTAGELLKFLPAAGSPPSSPPPSEVAIGTPPASSEPSASSSGSPSPSPSSATALLEAQMPKALNGTPFTIQAATDATSLGRNPTYRALDAGVTKLGKQPSDLELAEAYDGAGQLQVSVLGFRLPGVEPTKLRDLLLDVFLGTRTPGVTTTNITLVGVPVTKVSYPDGGAIEFVLVHGDSVFIVETASEANAEGIVQELEKPGSSASSGPSPSASGSPASPAPSSSAAPSPSAS